MLNASTFLKCFIALWSAFSVSTAWSEEADELRQKGIDALNDSQTNPRAIVDAARHFAKAADAYERAGDTEKSVEMNSFLYWCKKKMTLEDIDAFVKGGEAAVANTLNAVAEKKVDVNDAQVWFDRADNFAKAKPDEHLLIAIRFYEVADRFKGTEVSLRAQDRSLSEQTLALGTKRPPKSSPPVAADAAQPAVKLPVPDAAKQKEIEKQLKTILKDDYAKTRPEDKQALVKKLLTLSDDAGDDATTKFIELREARDLAAGLGDVPLVLRAIDKLKKAFQIDVLAVKTAAFKTLLDVPRAKETAKDIAKAIGEAVLEAIEEGIAADQYGALRPLGAFAETAAARAQNVPLTVRVKEKAAQIEELAREWPAAKTALEKLAAEPKQPAANLSAGRFICFLKNDMEHGLPHLACCSDAVLQKLATDDQSDPPETGPQVLLGDVWFELGEKEKSKQAGRTMLGRAGFWYTKALPGLTG